MAETSKKKTAFAIPDIQPGRWRCEILGSCTINFGQIVQPGEPRQSIEFTYLVMPGAFTGPNMRFLRPGLIMVLVPTPKQTEITDVGHLLKAEHLPSLHLSLQVTRAQFSDMLPMFEASRLKDLHFTVEAKMGNTWPISSWGVSPISS